MALLSPIAHNFGYGGLGLKKDVNKYKIYKRSF
jgi:hypothetical protein